MRWIKRSEQGKNTSRICWITFNNQTKSISEWARSLGLKRTTLIMRLKYGWGIKRSFTEEVHFNHN